MIGMMVYSPEMARKLGCLSGAVLGAIIGVISSETRHNTVTFSTSGIKRAYGLNEQEIEQGLKALHESGAITILLRSGDLNKVLVN